MCILSVTVDSFLYSTGNKLNKTSPWYPLRINSQSDCHVYSLLNDVSDVHGVSKCGKICSTGAEQRGHIADAS